MCSRAVLAFLDTLLLVDNAVAPELVLTQVENRHRSSYPSELCTGVLRQATRSVGTTQWQAYNLPVAPTTRATVGEVSISLALLLGHDWLSHDLSPAVLVALPLTPSLGLGRYMALREEYPQR